MGIGSFHYQLTRVAVALGPGSPLLRAYLRRSCRRFGVGVSFSNDAISLSREFRILRVAPRHFPYVPDIAQHFDVYFSQVAPEIRGESLIVDYSHPRAQRYNRSGLEFELSSLAEEGDAMEGYLHWYTPGLGDTVFDIGAYCGVSTYHFSRLVGPSGKVYCFEPDPENYFLLMRNIERHQLTNVTALPLAIAAHSGTAEFAGEAALGSALSRSLSRATTGTIRIVETVSFADACGRWGLPSFVKLDIEGAEIEVLSSAQALLMRHSIHFALDTNHWVNGKRTSGAIEQLFADCGYQTESSEKYGFMTTWAKKPSARG